MRVVVQVRHPIVEFPECARRARAGTVQSAAVSITKKIEKSELDRLTARAEKVIS